MLEHRPAKRLANELALDFDRDDGPGLADQLHHRLREAIVTGRIPGGSKLPSTRDLAKQLGVSRNTVIDAFERLLAESCLVARRGSGTFVGDTLDRPKVVNDPPDMVKGQKRRFILPAAASPGTLICDLRPGLPDLRRFPLTEWRRAALRKLRAETLLFQKDSDEGLGIPLLRAAISEYISVSRGATYGCEQILVTSGAQQAFSLLAQVIARPRMVVAVEDPGYPAAIEPFAQAGARIAPVPVDREGLVVDAIPKDAKLIYTTPAHQFPLGVAMSARRRHALLQWAAASDAWVVEDDYDSEYRFGGVRLKALQALDRNDRVIYVGSFSKTLLPSIRLGFVGLPLKLTESMIYAKRIADRHTASFSQAVLAEFMSTGAFAQHLRRMNALYEERHAALSSTLKNMDPTLAHLVRSDSGLHATLLLPSQYDVPTLIHRAASIGIGLYGLETFCRQAKLNGLILGFGNVETQALVRGVQQIPYLLNSA
ncbi:PLP-dependent aminotransferase family protein [Acidovorax sp.]|uniref:MocR-like pyridoxine biosynthesis transcription factor PdxR n=1 Tax=Acidovorax sp. TaxID=1872122 RepID=UPI0026065B3A|nr:PLP-dependent aminotransferase family protein [Acidovorax sp.]